jgi:hypothetical protein
MKDSPLIRFIPAPFVVPKWYVLARKIQMAGIRRLSISSLQKIKWYARIARTIWLYRQAPSSRILQPRPQKSNPVAATPSE